MFYPELSPTAQRTFVNGEQGCAAAVYLPPHRSDGAAGGGAGGAGGWRRVVSHTPGSNFAFVRSETSPIRLTEAHSRLRLKTRSFNMRREFTEVYAFSRPVIIRGLTDNTKFRLLCSKSSLLTEYGSRRVRLSTANTYSYRKVDVPFQEYVDVFLRPQSADVLGSDTLYFFGDNNFTEWRSLFEQYEPPPYVLPRTSGAYSFGIAGAGTGVPFHWHGPGYSEVIYGRKVLYFPDRWWHATLNLDTSVFISTFLG
uniref:Jumonji domain containing 8 n=1 Tax=Amphilophus citrinellus TaxID=61819 RepID=A0A3Q0SKR4_AMPCI